MTPSPRSSWSSPVPILELCENRQLAIDQVLERLIDPGHGLSTIAVLGQTGLGKSRAIQAFGAGAMARGMAVIELETGAHPQHPFATMLSGFPELEPLLFDDPEKPGWAEAVDVISKARTDVGLLILIDDAHEMDSESARFLTFLHKTSIRKKNAGPFVAVGMAVPEVDRLPDGLIRRLIKAQQTSYLELEPLHQTELAELVGLVFADASAPLRRALTVDLMHRSDGHPSVIDALIPLVDRSTYTIDLGPAPTLSSVEAVIEEANRSVVDGAFREAVEKLNSLNGVPGIDLNPATRNLLALSLFRIGAYREAERITGGLVEEALADDDAVAAFAAAMLGLPEAEQHEGSEVRVSWLLRIDTSRLSEEDRLSHAVVTGRQLVLVGRSDEAEQQWAAADRMAKTADERAAAASTRWYVTHHVDTPQEQCDRIRQMLTDPDLSVRWQLTMNEHLSISLYEAGEINRAVETVRKVGRYAETNEDVLRTWHYLCYLNLIAFEAGQWARAEQHRIEAMTHAQSNAIADGEHLYLAQKFNEAWVKHEQAAFAPMMSKLPPEIANSWFGRVAKIEALRSAGRVEEALADGHQLIKEAAAEPSHRVPPALAFLSKFIAEHASEADREAAFTMLERRAGSLLLHGLGTASFGPVDRYLFHISGDIAHLARAIEVADGAGVRLWQVLLRAEYAASAPGDHQLLLRQAEGLTAGTELAPLLDLWP